jgi:hypothetical protein
MSVIFPLAVDKTTCIIIEEGYEVGDSTYCIATEWTLHPSGLLFKRAAAAAAEMLSFQPDCHIDIVGQDATTDDSARASAIEPSPPRAAASPSTPRRSSTRPWFLMTLSDAFGCRAAVVGPAAARGPLVARLADAWGARLLILPAAGGLTMSGGGCGAFGGYLWLRSEGPPAQTPRHSSPMLPASVWRKRCHTLCTRERERERERER